MEQNQDCHQDSFEIGDLVYLKSLEPSWFLNDYLGIVFKKPDEHAHYLIFVIDDVYPVHPTAIKNIKEFENVVCTSNNN